MPHNYTSISNQNQHNSVVSMAIAITIIGFWFASLIGLLSQDLAQFPLFLIILGVWLRAFLHTGIFIIIHESIHGVVCRNKQINDAMGYLTSFLYALLPYKTLAKNHQHTS